MAKMFAQAIIVIFAKQVYALPIVTMNTVRERNNHQVMK